MKTSRLFFVISALLSFVLVACQSQPDLIEFQPKKDDLFELTFSYPATWTWEPSPNADKNYNAMTVHEPYPTEEEMRDIGRLIRVSVWATSRPQAEMQEDIDSYLEGITTLERLELLEDTIVQIDGHDARWLTIANTWESENPGVTYYREYIYLLADDRYYTIFIYIPETEKDGRFHQEFKAMIETIKILP